MIATAGLDLVRDTQGAQTAVFTLRFIELYLCTLGGVFFGYLGYKLFINGATMDRAVLESESAFGRIVLSGTGPGLFFMAFGAIVLVVAILNPLEHSSKRKVTVPTEATVSDEGGQPPPFVWPEAAPGDPLGVRPGPGLPGQMPGGAVADSAAANAASEGDRASPAGSVSSDQRGTQ